MHPLSALVWTHHRVLMTFETDESRSSLEMKLYVMPKKASGFSWAFCFSWLTVYTSLMESTAETKAAPRSGLQSLQNRQQHRLHLSSDNLMLHQDKLSDRVVIIFPSFIVDKSNKKANANSVFIHLSILPHVEWLMRQIAVSPKPHLVVLWCKALKIT